MHTSTILAAIATLTLTTTAQLQWLLDPFHAEDCGDNHNITFTICDPNAAVEQGGSGSVQCSFTWTGNSTTPPQCWSECPSNGYNFRVTAGTYHSAANFSIDVAQGFIDEGPVLNTATIPISHASYANEYNTSSYGYVCSRSGAELVCDLENPPTGLTPFYSSFDTGYFGDAPEPEPKC